jgi:tRNA A37 threonylcarbamoyladenosine dehydratase
MCFFLCLIDINFADYLKFMEYNELFARTELLIGSDAMQQIIAKKVILFGVGGVGSWCAEGLIRSGIMNLTIVDSDRVAAANINRQLPATTNTVGELKVEVLQKRLQEINPSAVIKSIPEIYDPESSASFHLEDYDYIIDAIDSLSNKAHLLVAASKTDAVTFSSMGAALKLDPQKIRVAEFWKVRGCKLGAALREKIRKGERTEKPILCVYSEEIQRNRGENALANANENGSFRKAQTNGTMVQVTAVFGFMLSSLVIQDIINKTNTIVTSEKNIKNNSVNPI